MKRKEAIITNPGESINTLESVKNDDFQALRENSVIKQIEEVIAKVKNKPPSQGVEMVLGLCENILCHSLSGLTVQEKDVLLGVMAQYTVLKQQYYEFDQVLETKKLAERER